MPVACNCCVSSYVCAVLKYQGKVFSPWSGARKFPLCLAFFSHTITRASFGFIVRGSVGWLGCRGHPRRFGWLLLWLPDGRGRKSTASGKVLRGAEMQFLCTEFSEWMYIPRCAGPGRTCWPGLREAVNTSFGIGDRWAGFPGWCWAWLGFCFPKLEAEPVAGNSAEAGRGCQALHRQHLGSKTGSPQPCSPQVLHWEENPSTCACGLVLTLCVRVLALPWHSGNFGKTFPPHTHSLEKGSSAGLAERCAGKALCLGLKRSVVTQLSVRRREKGVKRWHNKSFLPRLYVTECVYEMLLLVTWSSHGHSLELLCKPEWSVSPSSLLWLGRVNQQEIGSFCRFFKGFLSRVWQAAQQGSLLSTHAISCSGIS